MTDKTATAGADTCTCGCIGAWDSHDRDCPVRLAGADTPTPQSPRQREREGSMMTEQEMAEQMKPLNIQRCAEAMQLLYQTYILDQQIASNRGDAIQAINRMIVALGGEDTISKIEAVPWSARMRESGEADLVKLAENTANEMWRKP